MKKLLLLAIVLIGTGLFTEAQAQRIADNAIGLRIGGGNGTGAEISYQRALGGDNNRLELDLGWRNGNDYDAFKLAALYQWVWNIDGGFNWYVGAGGGLGSVDDKRRDYDDGGTYLFAAGDIGIEYDFEIPLMLSLDFRPEIGFADSNLVEDFSPDIALGIRYQF